MVKWYLTQNQQLQRSLSEKEGMWVKSPGGGGTPIHYLYGYVPPIGVVILKLLINITLLFI